MEPYYNQYVLGQILILIVSSSDFIFARLANFCEWVKKLISSPVLTRYSSVRIQCKNWELLNLDQVPGWLFNFTVLCGHNDGCRQDPSLAQSVSTVSVLFCVCIPQSHARFSNFRTYKWNATLSRNNPANQWRSQYRTKGGGRVLPWQRKYCRKLGKEEKNREKEEEKSGKKIKKKRKYREEKAKIGKVLSLSPPDK